MNHELKEPPPSQELLASVAALAEKIIGIFADEDGKVKQYYLNRKFKPYTLQSTGGWLVGNINVERVAGTYLHRQSRYEWHLVRCDNDNVVVYTCGRPLHSHISGDKYHVSPNRRQCLEFVEAVKNGLGGEFRTLIAEKKAAIEAQIAYEDSLAEADFAVAQEVETITV